jgi:hypothetical protein
MDPDQTPFFSDFKNAKKKISHIFFLQLTAGTLSSVFVLKFILQALLQSAQHLYEKREGSGSVPDPGGPKTCGSCGSGSPTLLKRGPIR